MRRTAVAVLAAAGGAAFAPAAEAPFQAPRAIELGGAGAPSALAAGDFNRDGKTDLVVARDGANDLIVLIGDGSARFRKGEPVSAGHSPTELFVADLDRDGNLDVAISNHERSYVTILFGDGRGGFRPAPYSPLTVHSKPHPHAIDGCDVDGDGWLDLVIDDWEENRLTLLLGDRKGGFQGPGTPIEVGRKPYRNLRLRDLNGDGKCDIVAPSHGKGVVTMLLGDGHGNFRAGGPIAAGPAPFTVDIGDLNGDGKPDLAISNYSGQITDPSDDAITFLLGDGRGGFRPGPRLATGHGPFQVAAGDVNGDGYCDAATADFGGRDLTVAFGGPEGLAPSRTVRVPLVSKPERVILVDVNGDGKADAVASSGEGRDVTVLLAK